MTSEEYDKALGIFLTEGLIDDQQANYLIGEIYSLQDNIKAVQYYTKAAKLGHTAAMNKFWGHNT